MFVIINTYKKPIKEVEKALQSHRDFLDVYYKNGNFLCSGPQNPRVGGVILCNASSKEEVEEIIKQDPFYKLEISDYQIVEFEANRFAVGFGRR